jgi:hypothetical protein
LQYRARNIAPNDCLHLRDVLANTVQLDKFARELLHAVETSAQLRNSKPDRLGDFQRVVCVVHGAPILFGPWTVKELG